MTRIFDFTDSQCDRMVVGSTTRGVAFRSVGVDRSEVCVILPPEQVAKLRRALAPHEPKPAPVEQVVSGAEYRLLPNACAGDGQVSSAVADGVTRVRVIGLSAMGGAGTYEVRGLDGRNAVNATEYLVHRRFLAAIEQPLQVVELTGAETHLDPVRVVAVEQALALFGASEFTDDVAADDVLAVARYIAAQDAA